MGLIKDGQFIMKKRHVYIIGSKGIPAKYGGFETFVEKLTENQLNQTIQYHIACMSENSTKSGIVDKHFTHNNADCYNISVPNIGPARAIYYDIAAIIYAIQLAKKNKDERPIFYVLACRIGPLISIIKKKIEKLNGQLYVNPDGHEWLRSKWSYPVRKYWKFSEQLMVKHANLLICDSRNIEEYIQKDYKYYYPETRYISYGTDLKNSDLKIDSEAIATWYRENDVKESNYYLVVGRFVPENNYKTMIKEFMKSNTTKDLVLITNIEDNTFYNKLKRETGFDKDYRIKFVGTVYDQKKLAYIREKSFAYIHGHEVGGTNPSLLESLAVTQLNILFDIGFNREVAETSAIYWTKEINSLANIINKTEMLTENEINVYTNKAIVRIKEFYNWESIVHKYETLFSFQA